MINAYEKLLAACQKATSDPMEYVRTWKQKNPGKKVIGYLPTYVPLEPIYAIGALPVGLWGGDVEITLADAYIQQFTCSIVRSVTEYAFSNAYDDLDAVLFPPICDSIKLVGSIWDLNLSKKFLVEMANLPERVDSPAAVTYLSAELRRVMGRISDQPITDSQFESGIAIVNRLRAVLDKFCDWRSERNVPLAEVATILRGATILHADEYCALVEGAISELDISYKQIPGIPVVVTGLSCQLPHLEMMRCFDEAGLKVVDDDLFLGIRGSAAAAITGNPFTNIAQSYCRSAPMAIRHSQQDNRHKALLEKITRNNAKGVVFMVPKFCEPEWFDLRYLQHEIKQRQIPSIVLDFEEGLGATGPLQTRLSAFAETIS